ncbi:MAG: EAL domain-containing protein [Chloroflexi bacterium]|nr:EAL domain-containing protein [Chloroflexota bacterium]
MALAARSGTGPAASLPPQVPPRPAATSRSLRVARPPGHALNATGLGGHAPTDGALVNAPADEHNLHGGHAASTDALRRLAADLPRSDGLGEALAEIVSNAVELFAVEHAAIWIWEEAHETPLRLAASHDLPEAVNQFVSGVPAATARPWVDMLQRDGSLVFADLAAPQVPPAVRDVYGRHGITSLCLVPATFRGELLGVVGLYHAQPHDWTKGDLVLAQSFGDTVATAVGNARLIASVEQLAARLRAVQELSARLSSLQDLRGIGEAIVAESKALITCDTIRVYRVDHETQWCEPIAFQGVFLGTPNPSPEQLRVKIGQGLTGWVAAHGEPLIIGDAATDARSVIVGPAAGPESMLVIPMSYEGKVRGIIVASRIGPDGFTEDDRLTLSIFAGTAGQALVNAERLDQLRQQQQELEHQLISQRRLLAVNERLLSTLDPSGVLDLIADSLKTVVAYDSLTIYRVDLARQVRRPVIARDRFAELILNFEAPLGMGLTGWAVDHREPVLANDAHLDARSVQIPGTPFEPESMIIVPLMAEGEVLGTLNIGRMGVAEAGAHYSQNEFELTKLFAAQAAIALKNAETHDEVKVQAERDALTGLRNHGSFQRELQALVDADENRPLAVLMMDLDRFKGFNDRNGHPRGDDLLVAVSRAIEGCIRQADRAYRYGGDEYAVILPDCARTAAEEVANRIRTAVTDIPDESGGPHVTISVGIACRPDDARTKDELVEIADQALFLAKGSRYGNSRDQFVQALDETAMGLLDGRGPEEVLDAILIRAARLLGVQHGYVDLIDDARENLVVRAGIGFMTQRIGTRLSVTEGIGGEVFRTGQPFSVDDYDAFVGRSADYTAMVGAGVGVPLSVGGETVGVLGLASGTTSRLFRQPEIDALARFAQLASIALERARLQEQVLSPRDPVTGLPSRETLIQRIVEAVAAPAAGETTAPVSVILLDLDRFQIVNESLGHAMGDRVLREVAGRLGSTTKTGDVVTRFGGDTYGVLLRSTDADAALATADRFAAALKPPLDLDGRMWFISASMGIAAGLPGAIGAGDLLQEAEIALVEAKTDPIRRVVLFDPLRSKHALERIDVEAELRLAIERDELTVHYQPILDLRTEAVVGFEALARWRHPTRGLVLPVDFIALAEETDLIVALGETVLEKACRQAQAWRRRWPDQNLVMSVNLSPRQFLDPSLVAKISSVLRRTKLEPRALELEITESSVMDRSEASLGVLEQLRAIGVRMVLDDFGTGYSSLAYLRHLPLDTIKIDRSFVTDLDVRDPNVGIVRAVVSLAHGLGVSVVAEGIETAEQARRLRELGCDLGQGYNWAHPADPSQTAAFIGHRLAAAAGDRSVTPSSTAAAADRAPVATAQRRLPKSRSMNRNRLTKSR